MACTTLPTPTPADICKAAGVSFMGVQPPEPDLNFAGLLLFNEPNGSTLAVSLPDASVAAIRARLSAHAKTETGEPWLETLRRLRG